MNLLTFPFKLPALPVQGAVLPLRGVLNLTQAIEGEAERQLADPVRLRRQLESIEQAEQAGEITAEQADELQRQVVMAYTQARQRRAGRSDEG
jgi:hypothetical protein